jgi:hypothetical protein
VAVTIDNGGEMAITLGYEGPAGLSYLNLAGYAYVTSSSFGEQPIYFDGIFQGNFYYSQGTFTATPEPSAAWLLLCGLSSIVARFMKKDVGSKPI